MYSKEQLRLKGEVEAPEFPKLTVHDVRSGLLKGAQKASWNLEEAAYYLNGYAPEDKLDAVQQSNVDRILFWLKKSKIQYLHGPTPSPGDYFRYMWSEHYPFCLKMWLLHHMWIEGDLPTFLSSHKSRLNHLKAMWVVHNEFSKVTNEDMADFLEVLSDELRGESGERLFKKLANSTLYDLVRKNKPQLSRGQPKSETTINPLDHRSYLFDLIRKEIG